VTTRRRTSWVWSGRPRNGEPLRFRPTKAPAWRGQLVTSISKRRGAVRLVGDCATRSRCGSIRRNLHGTADCDSWMTATAKNCSRRGQRIEHDRADRRHDERVENRARANEMNRRRQPLRAPLMFQIGFVGMSRSGRPIFAITECRRRCIARIECSEVRPIADVDARRADLDRNSLQSMQSPTFFAARLRRLGFLQRQPRLAAIVAIGDVERMLVGQRRLDARPRAHVEADLLAHVAGEDIGREGQHADRGVGDEGRLQGRQIDDQGSARRRNRAPRRRRSTRRSAARARV